MIITSKPIKFDYGIGNWTQSQPAKRAIARSLKGNQADNDAPYQRGNNLTLIGAIALRGMVGEMTLPGAVDALAFKTYVKQVLVPNLWAGACVVMDNQQPIKLLGSERRLKRLG